MKISRRTFIETSSLAVAGLGLSSDISARVQASDRIRMGFIGTGNRGSQLLGLFMRQPDCEIAALCDVYEPYLSRNRSEVDARYLKELNRQIPTMGEKFSRPPKIYGDWRKLLDDKNVDAVCIATPDHWHALQTIGAIRAGKDVYVEKPLTATIVEGRRMVEAQATGKQVVAVGLNRRGNPVYQKLSVDIPAGKIGKVTVSRAFRINNMYPDGIGSLQPAAPPASFDWDAWLGPRACRPYRYNIAPYRFRWWSDFSSQMGNWGVHFMDVIRWLMGETAPVAVSAQGGKYVLQHDGDIPDTMQVTYEFASGAIASFCVYEGSSGNLFPWGEIELRGTGGTLYAAQNGYRIEPAQAGQFQSWDAPVKAEEYSTRDEELSDGSSGGSTCNLVRNFLDCVKSRQQPLCTLEEGHRSTSFAHLANIALKVNERLQWDAVGERFTNHTQANELLHYDYRPQWKMYGL
jgi:predicted dehydrogenase